MSAEFITHTTREGDRWDLLAWTYYGDATWVSLLTKANPGVSLAPILPVGLSLKVPIVDAPEAASTPGLPPWRA